MIAIIAAILLFSVLAATLLPLVSSSREQTAFHHLADQAYFLAESGYRTALHRYHQSQTMEQKVAALKAMDGQRFHLDDAGAFDIRIFSYYFVLTQGAVAGANQCQAIVVGSFPPEVLENAMGRTQQLYIGNQPFEVNLSAPGDNGEITIRLEEGAVFNASLPSYTIGHPFVRSADFDPATGFLSYENDGGDLFPTAHGRIIVAGRILTYNYNNRGENRFEDIRDPSAPGPLPALDIVSGTPLILTSFSRVHSTGRVGQGASATHRELIYNGAFPQELFVWQEVMEESFSGESPLDSWQTVGETVAIEEVAGNPALRFATVGPDGGLATPAAAAGRRFTTYRGLTGGFLSYDAQVKLVFRELLLNIPNDGDPSSDVTRPFAGGLSFRLNTIDGSTPLALTAFNGYGLSIVRGHTGFQLPDAALEAGPLVVLWQQTGDIDTRIWLAFSTLDPLTEGVALLVRLHEAILLPFQQDGSAAIRPGDRIYGAASGAMGTVLSSPILSSGDWDDGSAAGTLLLNNVTSGSAFEENERLLVVNRSNSAARALTNVETHNKENIIRVYRANVTDYPRIVDNQRLQWPPDDMANEAFPFHLILWDEINGAIQNTSQLYPETSDPALRSIIRSHHPDLLSREWSGPTVAELGLHAFGEGANDIYFDDFGFRLIYPLREDFASPLQQ